VTTRLLGALLLALACTADAAEPVGYSFIVYMPKLMDAPFGFRGEGHMDLEQCNRVLTLAKVMSAKIAGGEGKFTGTFSICAIGGRTMIFPNE